MKKSSMKQPEPFNLKSTKLASKFIKLNVPPLILNITWWNRNLQIKKQELKALVRRLQKSRGEDRIQYKIVLSKKKKKKKELCSRKQSKESNVDLGDCYAPRQQTPNGTPYRSALKAYEPPSDIFQMMENSEKATPTEFRLKLLQKLYPKIAPRAAQIQPQQTLLEEGKFSQQEIDDILKNISKGKALDMMALILLL
ncbi:hypothetical protein AVEN_124195-1 [Araneus ventricosus]|uniref:Uncharacterized protein n=1 Tax=Araneus ventricosus TaxID=182803 RepID=A0A4Y2R9T0_ARAVE|nr:hypothetical protein AVEN_124195-1 [Araneus ventricosus]